MKKANDCYRLISAAALAAAGLLCAAPAFAAPGAPSPGVIQSQSRLPQAGVKASLGKAIVIPPSKGSKALSASTVEIPVSRIWIDGNRLIPNSTLARQVSSLVGRTVHLADLQKAARRITAVYHRQGYALAYAYVPPQKVRRGQVTIRVKEPRYDRIERKGKSRLRASEVHHTLGIRPGEAINTVPLSRGLLLLEQTPGVRVDGTLVPGSEPDTSTLRLSLHDRPAVWASVGTDNYGSTYTGRWREKVGAGLADPYGYGSRLDVNGLSTKGGLLHEIGASGISPNLWNGLRVGAYASRTIYTLGGQFSVLHEKGHANQYGIDATYPLLLRPGGMIGARIDLVHNGFGERSALAGIDRQYHVNDAKLSLDATWVEPIGGVLSGSLSLTRGNLGFDTKGPVAADAAGPKTRGGFWVGRLTLGQSQTLPWGLSLNANLTAQASSGNLDGSEKLYVGGPGGVMSYAVGQGGGDEGAMLRLRLSHAVPLPAEFGHLRLSALVQGASLRLSHTRYGPGQNAVSIGGAGVSMNYRWHRRLTLSASYVRQVGPTPNSFSAGHSGETWFSANIRF